MGWHKGDGLRLERLVVGVGIDVSEIGNVSLVSHTIRKLCFDSKLTLTPWCWFRVVEIRDVFRIHWKSFRVLTFYERRLHWQSCNRFMKFEIGWVYWWQINKNIFILILNGCGDVPITDNRITWLYRYEHTETFNTHIRFEYRESRISIVMTDLNFFQIGI